MHHAKLGPIWLLMLPLLLTACIGLIPTPITVATGAINGVTYLATGKTATDHALSFVMQRDCSMMRVVAEANLDICYQAPSSLTAFAFTPGEPWPMAFNDWEFEDIEIPGQQARENAMTSPDLRLAGDGKEDGTSYQTMVLPEDENQIWEFSGMSPASVADPVAPIQVGRATDARTAHIEL